MNRRAQRRAAARGRPQRVAERITAAMAEAERAGCQWCMGDLIIYGDPKVDNKPEYCVYHTADCVGRRLPYWVTTGHPAMGCVDRDHPEITPPRVWKARI
jgi:hypothetical protein